MTYIDAINQMWVANDSYDFTHAEIVIYMVLLDRWNRAGRKYEVGIDYRDVMETAKTCKTTYYQALKKLAKVGLIAYKSGHKSSSLGKLQVLKFDTGNGTETERKRNQDGTETEHYKEELKSTLENKENKSFLECVSSNTHDEKKSFESDDVITDVEILSSDSLSPPVAAPPPSRPKDTDKWAYAKFKALGFTEAECQEHTIRFINLNDGYGWKQRRENAFETFLTQIPNHERRTQKLAKSGSNESSGYHYDSDDDINRFFGSPNVN